MAEQSYADFSWTRHTDANQQGRVTNVQVELTYGCNLHCVHCYTDCYNQPESLRRELTADEWERIFDELRDLGVLWLALTGGEVFVRKDFRRLYLAAKARGFIVSLLSNATTITEELADFLAAQPPLKVEISCHGATRDTFEAVTQVPGSFAKFREGLARLRARGIGMELKTSLMSMNHTELSQLQALAAELGANHRVSTTIHPRLNGDVTPAQYRLPPEMIAGLGEDAEQGCQRAAPATAAALLQPPADDRLYRCGCGGWSAHINAWGELGACTWSLPRISVRTHTVAEALAQCRAQIHGARYTSNSPCRSCTVHHFCHKMPAASWAETPGGDVEQPVPHVCETAFASARRATGLALEAPVA